VALGLQGAGTNLLVDAVNDWVRFAEVAGSCGRVDFGGHRSFFGSDLFVLGVDVNDPRLVRAKILRAGNPVGRDNDDVTGMHEMRRRPVDANDAAPWRTHHRVSNHAATGRYIVNVDLLEFGDVRRFQQAGV